MKRVMMIVVCMLSPFFLGAMAQDDVDEREMEISSFLNSSEGEQKDEVAEMIFGKPGKRDRKYEINALIDDHLSGDKLTYKQRKKLKKHLRSLNDEEYTSVIGKMGIVRGKKGSSFPKKIDVTTALLAIVDEMKEQNKLMESSGKVQQRAYEQQVESAEFQRHMWRHRFWGVIAGAVVTNAIQLVINIWQASQNSDDQTNSTAS